MPTEAETVRATAGRVRLTPAERANRDAARGMVAELARAWSLKRALGDAESKGVEPCAASR